MIGRELFCTLLAQHAGQALTREVAVDLINAIFPDRSIDPARFAPVEYRGLVFQVERFRDIETEIHALHAMHWAETERYRDAMAMVPDYEGFKEKERDGGLIQFTARADGALVGNIRMYLFRSMHTQQLAAKEDTFFLLAAHRSGFTAIRFWQHMENVLRALGVKEITTDSKVTNKVGRLNEYLGYAHVADVYHKLL
ncbi:hypothetical protein [Rhodoferax koreensis]|nr:hypothetical protein [Rhodoferax koreense]